MKRNILIARDVVLALILCTLVGLGAKWYFRADNGIYSTSKNVALIKGSCITINWDATESEAEAALAKWQELKKN